MADVDAVNERLNGLVTLLQAVGVGSSIDKGEVDRVSSNFSKGELPLPDARQLNDDQVEALIRKLQQAQAEAPQIIAALEAHAEARSLNGGGGSNRSREQQRHHEEEEEEEEEDDEFDEDANYPMVGAGCSDDISVVSDLTTPTVLTGVPIPEEEHYRDTLPPMVVGGGSGEAPPMMINPTKRKNLVNQVNSRGVPPPRRNTPNQRQSGTAAARRRKNYQSTMAKLHENPHSAAYAGSSGGHAKKGPPKTKSANAGPKKRSTKKEASNFSELASSRAGNEWESPNKNWHQSSTTIDNDGFLVGDSFDPFSSEGANPFKKSSAAGDLAFGGGGGGGGGGGDPFSSSRSSDGFDAFGAPTSSSNPRKSTRPKRPESRKAPSGGSSSSGGRQRRSRRASLAM